MGVKLEKQNARSGSESARTVRFSLKPESADRAFFLPDRVHGLSPDRAFLLLAEAVIKLFAFLCFKACKNEFNALY